jgi:hypothetical protein
MRLVFVELKGGGWPRNSENSGEAPPRPDPKSLRHWSEPDPRGRGDLAQRRKWRAGPVCSGDSRMSIWS